jgi:hypothetical protein
MIPKKGLTLLAVVAFGAGLFASPAWARCPKECKQDFAADLKACKNECKELTDKPAKKQCKRDCVAEKKRRKDKCKAAAAPTFPGCSPSGAFLDPSLP